MFIPKSDNAYKVYEQKNAIQKDHTLGSYYISEEKYTNKEIKFIFEVIFNTSITDLDIQSCNEIDYILLRGYIEPLLNFYFSKNYDQIVETYMKKI